MLFVFFPVLAFILVLEKDSNFDADLQRRLSTSVVNSAGSNFVAIYYLVMVRLSKKCHQTKEVRIQVDWKKFVRDAMLRIYAWAEHVLADVGLVSSLGFQFAKSEV